MRCRCRKAGAALAFLAVLLAIPWLVPDQPDSPISVLVIHRRLPDLSKGCDARLVTLLSDLVLGSVPQGCHPTS